MKSGLQIDQMVKKHTAFESMQAMLNAKGGYRPSLNVFRREVKAIANEYDRLQKERGDNRRAFRHPARGDRRERIRELISTLEEIESEEQEAFDNTPEPIQQGEAGMKMETAIEALQSAQQSLEEAIDDV